MNTWNKRTVTARHTNKPIRSILGTKPRKSASPKQRRNARIVSFDDAKRAPARKRSRKEISIARGEKREGALEMRSEEEIEAQARSEEASRKQAKRKNSRVLAFSEELRKRSESKKRARNKAKADKKFDAAYGGDGPSGSQPAQGESGAGPRAALYKGKMGSSQKKSSKLQAKEAGAAIKGAVSGATIPKVSLSRVPKGLWRTLLSVGVAALFVVMLYEPAQQYYQQMRETDRLQAEYAAVAARSNTLQSTIDSLSSEEGIEDKAHTDLGYVKKGEQTATVKGVNIVDDEEFSSNVAPGSIPAPETWYSPVLDTLFGYSG